MRARTVVMLLAGRGAGRLAQYGAGFALLAVWGPTVFAGYAAATGVGLWVFAVSATGVERAALVTVGATDGRRLEAMFAAFGVAPFALSVAVWALLGLAAPGGGAVRYAAGIAFMSGTGTAAVLVALLRLRGRPGADAAAYAALSAGYGGSVGLAAVAGVGVNGVLAAQIAAVAAIVLALLLVLRPGRRRAGDSGDSGDADRVGGPTRADVRAGVRTAALLAAGDVLGNAAVSVLYVEMAVRAPAAQSSLLYVCLVASVAFGTLSNYVLRLWQPNILVWLADDPDGVRVRLRRGLLAAAGFGGAASVAAGVLAVVVPADANVALAAAPALAVEIGAFLAVAVAAFVVESVDDRARLHSASSAVAALVAVAALGWLLIPAAGAAGALVALAAGWLVRVPSLLIAVRPSPVDGSRTGPGAPSRRG